MQITLDTLLKGSATLIKSKEYLSTSDYVQPFMDAMAAYTKEFYVRVKLADQLALNSDDNTNVIYNRVLIEAVLPIEHVIDGHQEVIGFVYGLDIRKPVAKLYRAYKNKENGSLVVFNSNWIIQEEIEPEKELSYPVEKLLSMTNDVPAILKKMKSETVEVDSQKSNLGHWVDFTLCKSLNNGIHSTKLSPNMSIDAYKMLYINEESPYFTPEAEVSTVHNIYNAFTQTITDDDKDIMNKFEKTLLINKLLNISGK